MHKNTLLLVSLLAVFAALLVGFNLGKKFSPPSPAVFPTITQQSIPAASPSASLQLYTSTACGFSLEHPRTLTKFDSASGSAVLTDPNNAGDTIVITCQKNIPRSPLPPEKIETVGVWNANRSASISAKLYHDTSAKDGKPVDVLIFRHPKTGLDVFLAGTGESFREVISTLILL